MSLRTARQKCIDLQSRKGMVESEAKKYDFSSVN